VIDSPVKYGPPEVEGKETMARTTKMRLEPKARAFVRHLYRKTDGRPMAWRMLHGMPTTAEAVALAVDLGWCEVAGGRIVCLRRG
jgi:hypothetical protein